MAFSGSLENTLAVNWQVMWRPLQGTSARDYNTRTWGRSLRHITIDDLGDSEVTGFGGEVEGLRLDVGRVQALPPEVVPGQLGVGSLLGLLCDGLDGSGAIDGLLRPGDVRQPRRVSRSAPGVQDGEGRGRHRRERVRRLRTAAWPS